MQRCVFCLVSARPASILFNQVCFQLQIGLSYYIPMILIFRFYISVVFMSIGLITFGVKTADNYHGAGGLNFSYAFVAVGTILCLIAGILALVQMWTSRVV